MPDVDSRLDRRLRVFLDEIKAQPLPQQLADFKPATVRSGRKVLNVLAGTLAVAVIAATATVFAIELNGHHGPGSPVPGDKAGPTSTPKPTPSSPAASSLPTGARVLIPPTYGTGTETLPTVTLGPNEGIWIEYTCSSGDSTPFNSIFLSGHGVPVFLGPHFQFWLHEFSTPNRCSGTLSTDGGQGGALSVRFNAAHPSVTWMIRVYEYPSRAIFNTPPPPWSTAPSFPGSTPPFLDAPAPPGANVLVKITYGWGSETLPTVTVARHVPLVIEGGCISTSASANTLTIGSGDPAFNGSIEMGQCFYGTGAGGSSGGNVGSGAGGPLTLRVVAAPTVRWVILVYEGGGSPSRWGPPA
jgi:hypothetical protein